MAILHTKKNTLYFLIIVCAIASSCGDSTTQKIREKLNYKNFIARFKKHKDSIATIDKSDTANLFDKEDYDPSKMDSTEVLNKISKMYSKDSLEIVKNGVDKTGELKNNSLVSDSVNTKTDSFTNDIKKILPQEIGALKYNLNQLKQDITNKKTDSNATHKQCTVWADVSKKDQRLYLYIEGECVDTFKISSGDKNHKTPNIDRQPCGPAFQKYTSKKFPGGNWNGLGNMPYVVFVQGGYALHGTTIGNIRKLGNPASHGCIRLHPNNAKIFFELVKTVGVNNTWVTIRD